MSDTKASPSSGAQPGDSVVVEQPRRSGFWREEDWWAVWLGSFILLVGFLAVHWARPVDWRDKLAVHETLQTQAQQQIAWGRPSEPGGSGSGRRPDATSLARAGELRAWKNRLKESLAALAPNPLSAWVTKPQPWLHSPLEAFRKPSGNSVRSLLPGMLLLGLASLLLFGLGERGMGRSFWSFAAAFPAVFALTVVAFVLASQALIRNLNLEYPLWALLIGLAIANTIGTPHWLRPAVRTEYYIKTGLVLLGAEILLGNLLALGVPGIGVSWVVTPIVLIVTFWFGQRVLRIASPSLNMTISADMSVCGVSAAIATAAACRAKKEELSVAIGLSLTFTVVMMFVMPLVIRAVGMSEVLGGAWMGGTIDATGAVAAASALLGETAASVAITVKMIQNIMIGLIAFAVAVYWVTCVQPDEVGTRPSLWEIWYRFPKFVMGFVAASVVFSLIASQVLGGKVQVESMIKGSTATLRNWFFCYAFVCIGLDTHFRTLARHFRGGKPLVLYVAGQSLNLGLTLLMAWLMFEVLFPQAASNL